MDTYRDHPSEFDTSDGAAEDVAESAAPIVGTDERRMHVRAYNYWVSLLKGRDYPSIEDLDPASVSDFAGNSILLDFTAGDGNPSMPYLGTAIRSECGIDSEIESIADVPNRSLLSRLTDHYLQIIANRAPIGFEAEFENQRNVQICYRGILMPFSSDGDTIDFIYGVINWKVAEDDLDNMTSNVGAAVAEPAPVAQSPDPEPQLCAPQATHFAWEDGPLADPEIDEPAPVVLDEDAGLADRLWAARETADHLKAAEGRSRTALYRALAMAHDFAVAALDDPETYGELLTESGVKAQARAPLTPVVKLIFGIDYDKARLTEYAAALSYARREGLGSGEFLDFIEAQAGGLKAIVAAERKARRPQAKVDSRFEAGRATLRSAPPVTLSDVNSEQEFTLVLARRRAGGGVEPVAIVEDEAIVDRAIRRVAG